MNRPSALVVFGVTALLECGTSRPPVLASVSGQVTAAARPVIAANLVYSHVHGRVLMVNGSENFKNEIETRVWSWDGREWQALDGAGPPVRNLGAAAFDASRGELVFFGGFRPRDPRGDMAVWKDGRWRHVADTPVGLRDHHVMAYDSARQRVVLFGGDGARPEGNGRRISPVDTWEWDGERWAQVATTGPGPRGRSAMVYDERRREMVLFGGAAAGMQGDTWMWNGTRWREATVAGPPARYAHAMAYDSRRGVVVLYGGSSAFKPAQYLTDMWEWNGERWTAIGQPPVNPGIRYSPGMEYDRRRGRLVLYGGMQPADGGGSRYVFDTWEWDGRRWTEVRFGD